MSDTSESTKPIQKSDRLAIVSFTLSLIGIPCTLLTMGFAYFAYYGLNWHLLDISQLLINLSFTFIIPFLISIASIAIGINALHIKKEDQKGVWKAIFGIVFGILELLFIGLCTWQTAFY